MQLYEVWFQLHFNNVVDVGRAIVCAQDQTKAKETVIALLELDVTALKQCDVKRIRPNLFLLERKDVTKPLAPPVVQDFTNGDGDYDKPAAQKGLRAISDRLGENREYRHEMSAYVAQQEWAREHHGRVENSEFECEVLASVTAPDEETALRRLAGSLRERSFGIKDESRYVKKVLVNISVDSDIPARQITATG
jgi:hypothetical protein